MYGCRKGGHILAITFLVEIYLFLCFEIEIYSLLPPPLEKILLTTMLM